MASVLGLGIDEVTSSYEGTIEVSKVAWVERKIGEAERSLFAIIPQLKTRVVDGTIDIDLVKDKVIAAVLRVVRNPFGIENEGEGDYSIKLNKLVASGDIWFPEKDLIELGWTPAKNRGHTRTVHSKATPGWGFPG